MVFTWKSPGKPGLACSCLPLLPEALSNHSKVASNRLGLSYKESSAAFPCKISVCRDWGFLAPPPANIQKGPSPRVKTQVQPATVLSTAAALAPEVLPLFFPHTITVTQQVCFLHKWLFFPTILSPSLASLSGSRRSQQVHPEKHP
mgnify:CR=1 FL=1